MYNFDMENGKRPQAKEQRQKQVISKLKNENVKLREKFQKKDMQIFDLSKNGSYAKQSENRTLSI